MSDFEHVFEKPPEGAAADWTIPQNWAAYTEVEHQTWDTLYARQMKILPGRAETEVAGAVRLLLDPANWTTNEVFWRGANRRYLELDWQGFRIWGVTAAIIANLSRRVSLEALRDAA